MNYSLLVFFSKELTFACCSILLTRIRSAKGTTFLVTAEAALTANNNEEVARI